MTTCLRCGQLFSPYHEFRCTRCGLRYHSQLETERKDAVYSLDKRELFIHVPSGTLPVFGWEEI